MPPFDFLHFLLKSACSLPEFVGSLMWPPHSSLNGSKSEKTEKGLHSNTSLAPRGSRLHEVLEVWILIPNFMLQIHKEDFRRSAF